MAISRSNVSYGAILRAKKKEAKTLKTAVVALASAAVAVVVRVVLKRV